MACLEKEGRLLDKEGNINQTTLINFVPTRPVEEIASEYVDSFWRLYDPHTYLGFAEKVFWRGSEVRSQKSEVRRGNQNNLDNLKVYGF